LGDHYLFSGAIVQLDAVADSSILVERHRLGQLGILPALQKGGHDKHMIGYFQADTGTITSVSICGSSRTTPTGVPIGQQCLRTRIVRHQH
jgi:hypothetical protein